MDNQDKNQTSDDQTLPTEPVVKQPVEKKNPDTNIPEPNVKTEEQVEAKEKPQSPQQPESENPQEEEARDDKEQAVPSGAPQASATSTGAANRQDPEPEEPDQPVSQAQDSTQPTSDTANPNAKWYVVHTYSGHENKVSSAIKQRVESEHLEHKILDVLVPTQDKIEIKAGKKEQVKEKIFPGYILVKMVLDDASWLAVRTTQGVTSFVGIGNKPTPIPDHEVKTIVKFMEQGPTAAFKDVYQINDTIKIIDGPFADFIGKVDTVDKEKGKVRVLVSIFGRETPVELDFLQIQKL